MSLSVKKKPQWDNLGSLETSVMELVWRKAPATAREVCDRLTGANERAYTTIMTTMDRLHRKGLLEREKDGLAWRYSPTVSKAEFKQTVARGLAAALLRKDRESGLSAFVDTAAGLDEALLDRLAELIRQRRGRR